ncbi:MAG: acetate kinase [Propionibacteriaceae bacterium]|jgi:acetate kinase|nr:acetate kinase [Propionibacteriaceae bacterium]
MSTPILVLNCGSSSVKYQVIDAESEAVLGSGLVEKIGLPDSELTHKTPEGEHELNQEIPDHSEALRVVVKAFEKFGPPLGEVVAVGHRVVHGGRRFLKTTLIDDEVVAGIEAIAGLAPLHNPAGVAGIKAAQAALPGVPHVAIFDTAFFTTLPAEASTYAIDKEIAEKYQIRKYGFHGTSHSYVSKKVASFLGRDASSLKQIVCHLGNGASISAIDGGVAVDTSMGLTPLAGLVMGTRSGDVDPGIFAYLQRAAGMDATAVDDLLNKHSGVAGLSGGSSDMRDLQAKVDAGNDPDATLTYDVYIRRIVGYIGNYIAILGGVDVLTFTAGVGENDEKVRADVARRLEPLGFVIDDERNIPKVRQPLVISANGSPVTILVVPTNEELAMAREVEDILGDKLDGLPSAEDVQAEGMAA